MYAPQPQLNSRNHVSVKASAPAPQQWLRVPTRHVHTAAPVDARAGDLVAIVHPRDALLYLTLCSAAYHNGYALNIITRDHRVRAQPFWWLGPSPVYAYTGPIRLQATAQLQLLGQ